jgi:hypothetical protein
VVSVTGRGLVFFLPFFFGVLTCFWLCGIDFIPQSFAQVKPVTAIPDSADDAPIPADKLFPDSVKGFVAIQDLKLLAEQWKKTQIGLLMQDPIMKPFQDDFNAQIEKWMENRLGLNLDGIEQLPSGEVAFGMIAIPEKTPGYVFTMDAADRRKQVANYIEELTKKFLTIGIKRSVEKYKDDEIIVFTFPEINLEPEKIDAEKPVNDKPTTTTTSPSSTPSRTGKTTPRGNSKDSAKDREREKDRERDRNRDRDRDREAKKTPTDAVAKNSADSDRQKVYYLLKKDYLVISNQLHLIYLFADRIASGNAVTNSLSDIKEYQGVLSRCLSGLSEDSFPLIHWYIEPLNYGESMRVLFRRAESERRKSKKSIFASLKEQGFDAVRGVGGTVSIKTDNREVAYRVFVHTVKPYKLAMKMFNLPNSTNFTPPQWIPVDAARCSVALVEPLTIFDNFGTLFDELVAQGESGVFNDIMKGLRDDPKGPRVDVREEFIVNMGERAFTMSNYSKPISEESESIVIGIELKEPNKNKKEGELDPAEIVKKAVDKVFNNDPDMKQTKHKDYIIWHRAPADFTPPITIDIPPIPTLEENTVGDNNRDESQPIFPEGGITVTPKYLIACTNVEYLKKIIDRLDAKDGLIVEHVDYKATEEVFKSLGVDKKPHFVQFFSRSDESIEPTYEMIRQGKMPKSKAILGRLINAILMPDNENGAVREQEFNWEKLPEFEKVRHAFGPAALYGESIENGFFFEGFLLKKEIPNEKKEEKKEEEKKE